MTVTKLTPATSIDTSPSNPHTFVATDMTEDGEYTPVWVTNIEASTDTVELRLTRTLSTDGSRIPAVLRAARAAICHAVDELSCDVIACPTTITERAICVRLDMVHLDEQTLIFRRPAAAVKSRP